MERPEWIHDFGEWLTYGNTAPELKVGESSTIFSQDRKYTWLARFLQWVSKFYYFRKIDIRIDKHDTYSMDATLSPIILPMLKQLKATTHGAGFVDDEDVPDHLKSTSIKENECDAYPSTFDRWNWALDEMIWAFEQLSRDDWEDQFHTGKIEMISVKREDGMFEIKRSKNDTSHFDAEGYKAFDARITNGTRLFGKYYRSLWD